MAPQRRFASQSDCTVASLPSRFPMWASTFARRPQDGTKTHRLPLLAAVGFICFVTATAASTTADRPALETTNAATLWNVVSDWVFRDPSWSPANPLSQWQCISGTATSGYSFGQQNECCPREREHGHVRYYACGTGSVNFAALPVTFPLFAFQFPVANLTGVMPDLALLPSMLTRLDVGGNFFSGSLAWSTTTKGGRQLQQLDLSANQFSGSFSFAALPSTLTTLSIADNTLTSAPAEASVFAAKRLPRGLQQLNMSWNQFTGQLDLSHMPPALQVFSLSYNSFAGSILHDDGDAPSAAIPLTVFDIRANNNLTGDAGSLVSYLHQVAPGITTFAISRNQFSGTIPWTWFFVNISAASLDHNLLTGGVALSSTWQFCESFDISANQFSGPVDLTQLSTWSFLSDIDLSGNALSGTVNLGQLPSFYLTSVVLSYNRFAGVTGLDRLPSSLSYLDLSHNAIASTLDTATLGSGLGTLLLQHNQFQGSFHVESLPGYVGYVNVSHNHFSGSLVNMSLVPYLLSSLDLSWNDFNGHVDLLPLTSTNLNVLALSGNFFSGPLGTVTVSQGSLAPLEVLAIDHTSISGTLDLTMEDQMYITVDVAAMPKLFAIVCPYCCPPNGTLCAAVNVPQHVRILNASQPQINVPNGTYEDGGHGVTLNLGATAGTIASCSSPIPASNVGGLQYATDWGYVGQSPMWLQPLIPCLPSKFKAAVPQYAAVTLMDAKVTGLQIFTSDATLTYSFVLQ